LLGKDKDMTQTLSRRSALKHLAAGAAALGVAGGPAKTNAAEQQSSSGLKGNIRHSACKWCYGKIPLEEFCEAAKDIGLEGIDLLGVEDFPTLKKHGLACSMVSGVPGGINSGLNKTENHDKIFAYFEKTLPIVAEHGYANLICFSGNRGEGLSDEQGLENCAQGLKRIVPLAEKHKVTICMELLNSKRNHKGYMCDYSKWGVDLCKKVGSERFKLLYDIYHMQIMEGDVIDTIRENHPYYGHYHTGGVPGRAEIDETQELYYPAIMKAILATGFKGFVAQEFVPKRDPLASLRQAVGICDV
jgi:hydroxypyruvate isomerase